MAGVEKFYDNGQSSSASHKRAVQLKDWESSATNKQPSTILASRLKPTIRFADSVVFLAAAHSGDTVEVEKMVLNEGADVNSVNKDGLTALHQCCIDDDFDMVKTLVRLGANVDQQDKEGWTPLHAAASCGNTHIVGFLLEHGAFPALVNNEGDTPLDLAEDSDDIADLLQERIDRDMIDMDAVRGVEEAMMLEDANRLKNDPTLKPLLSHADATPLHVASAKSYLQVMKVLLSLKASQVQVDAVDEDGWTPLHAAVYWGNFEAAELLVTHGAQIDKKTNAGDMVEDLCEPELEDELDTLKKYQNNRLRSNAMSKPRQLLHSNSREDMGVKHPSPQIVRRRSSKERSMFPKIDIAKEREEREIFAAESGDLGGSPSSVRITSGGNPSPLKSNLKINQNVIGKHSTSSETREVLQDHSNSSKDHSSDKTKNQGVESQGLKVNKSQGIEADGKLGDPSLTDSPTGSPPQRAKSGSPKTAKKKFTGMSPKMLMRVEKWESQTNIVTTPPPSSTTCTSSNSSSSSTRNQASSSRGPLPLASSTPSSTVSPQQTSNGDSSSRFLTETKRYSFQPKTISPASSLSSLPPRSMSVDRTTIAANVKGPIGSKKTSLEERISVTTISHSHRSSFDETNSAKKILESSLEETGYKTSSLPRMSTKIAKEDSGKDGAKEKKIAAESKNETEASAVATEGSATPGAETEISLLGVAETKREQSVESNTSSRGGLDDSETNRKITARKKRKDRKQTQGVPTDLMEQISKHKEPDSSTVSILNTSSDIDQDVASDSNHDNNSTEENSPEEKRKRTFSSSKTSYDSPDSSGDRSHKKEDAGSRPVMSSYKPRTRPSSKILMNAVSWAQQQSSQESGDSSAPSPKMADVVEQKMRAESTIKSHGSTSSTPISTEPPSPSSSKPANTSDVSPSRSPGEACKPDPSASHLLHPRTKSTARRKPREKRRSTGIVTEVAEGEEVPEELSNLVRKSGDGAMSTSSHNDHTPNSAGEDEDPLPQSQFQNDDEELSCLRLLLEEEQVKNKKVEKELEETRGKVQELNRRFEDATRAYEQERRENELKDARIEELQSNSKTLQDLKHENQRMKDENSALIRVIGKLSRSPLPQHAHT